MTCEHCRGQGGCSCCGQLTSPLMQRNEELAKRVAAVEEKVDQLTKRVVDYAHLKKLYDESRQYIRALEGERDDLIEAAKRHVADVNELDAELLRMRPVYEAAKRERLAIPCDAAEMRERSFHPASCDLVEAVDRAIAVEAQTTPYR